MNGEEALLLLRLNRKESAVGQFVALNQQIEDLSRETRRRKLAEAAARQEAEWLRVTLQSIGEAVIVTDAQGRVEFLNPVAAELVGWETSEAARRRLEDVFQTVNEETRQPAENTALRALREGKVVRLANQTVLISKNGMEFLIDESAAPIRDHHGAVFGSVLVFRDITKRKQAETALNEHVRALVQGSDLGAMLQECSEALVKYLDRAFARIWTLNPQDNVLNFRPAPACTRTLTARTVGFRSASTRSG